MQLRILLLLRELQQVQKAQRLSCRSVRDVLYGQAIP